MKLFLPTLALAAALGTAHGKKQDAVIARIQKNNADFIKLASSVSSVLEPAKGDRVPNTVPGLPPKMPLCGSGSASYVPTDTCGLSPLAHFFGGRAADSPMYDVLGGLMAYMNLFASFGELGFPTQSGWKEENCDFVKSYGAAVFAGTICLPSAYSYPAVPIVPKYACKSSPVEKMYDCWRQAALGDCSGECSPLTQAQLDLPWVQTIATLFGMHAGDASITCAPKDFDFAAADDAWNKMVDSQVNPEAPMEVIPEFVNLFKTNDNDCDGNNAMIAANFFVGNFQGGLEMDKTMFMDMHQSCVDAAPATGPYDDAACSAAGPLFKPKLRKGRMALPFRIPGLKAPKLPFDYALLGFLN